MLGISRGMVACAAGSTKFSIRQQRGSCLSKEREIYNMYSNSNILLFDNQNYTSTLNVNFKIY